MELIPIFLLLYMVIKLTSQQKVHFRLLASTIPPPDYSQLGYFTQTTNITESVIPFGFEPKAYSLEGCRSIQLSYGTSAFL